MDNNTIPYVSSIKYGSATNPIYYHHRRFPIDERGEVDVILSDMDKVEGDFINIITSPNIEADLYLIDKIVIYETRFKYTLKLIL